jgi:cell division protein FtsZ
MMGTGVGEGDKRALRAAQDAISSPLLEDGSVTGARGVIINVTGGPDLSLMEVNEASCVIQEAAHEDANIIFGAVVDPTLGGKVKITVIATGFDRAPTSRQPVAPMQTPVDLQNYSTHLSRQAEPEAVQPAIPVEAAASPRDAAVPPLTVTRRAGLELPMPAVESADLESPLDVPAFLRRQH